MKKYGILTVITIIASTVIVIFGEIIKNSIPKVDAIKIEPLTVSNSVTCSGLVISKNDSDVYAPVSAYVENVYVKVGDKVEAGDPLMDISLPNSSEYQNDSQYSDVYEAYASYLNQPEKAASSLTVTTKSLIAPTSGTITAALNREPGYYVDPSKPAFVIQGDKDLQVRLNVNESQISDIKVGQSAEITGVGFKYSSYSGSVTKISKKAKQINSTSGKLTIVEVTVSVDHPGNDIKPGFTAKAKIMTSNDTNVVLAPYDSVRADDNGKEFVFKIINGKAVKTHIVTGKEFDDGFEVVKGLSPNDRIIQKPEKIWDGETIRAAGAKAVRCNG